MSTTEIWSNRVKSCPELKKSLGFEKDRTSMPKNAPTILNDIRTRRNKLLEQLIYICFKIVFYLDNTVLKYRLKNYPFGLKAHEVLARYHIA